MSDPVPYWRGERDYFGARDPRRNQHQREIDIQARINRRIDEAMCNGTYRVLITREEMAKWG